MEFSIQGRKIGTDHPTFVIAEMSANHGGSLGKALEIVHAAKESGADALKLQTYTPDSLTIDSDKPWFKINEGLWKGETLYGLYEKAHLPWDWHGPIFAEAAKLDLPCFSTPFDLAALKLLEELGAPAHKVASFEAVDYRLIRAVAATGKPVILSTGMCTHAEILDALGALRDSGCAEIGLLKCVSSYPAPYEDMNLATIPEYAGRFGVVPGLSDHTLGPAIAVAAVALGARIIEKHFILDRRDQTADAAFSIEPAEFKDMVAMIRQVEKAVGQPTFAPTSSEKQSLLFRRSIFAVRDIPAGGTLSDDNIRVIRPGHGLHPIRLGEVLGQKLSKPIERGEPLTPGHLNALMQ